MRIGQDSSPRYETLFMQARHCWLMALLVLAGPLSARAEDGVTWAAGVEAARQQAAETNRLVLLHFWAPWCPPCRNLEKNVFNKPQVAKAMARDFVPVKLDVDDHKQLAQALQVGPIPCDVVITPQGEFVHKTISPSSVEKYIARLHEMAAVAGRTTSAQALWAANQSPSGPAPGPAPAPVHPPYGQQLIDGRPNAVEPSPAARPAAGAEQPGSAFTSRPPSPAVPNTGPKWYERLGSGQPAEPPRAAGQHQGPTDVAGPRETPKAAEPAPSVAAPGTSGPSVAGPSVGDPGASVPGVSAPGVAGPPSIGRDSTPGPRVGAAPWSSGALGANVGAKIGVSAPEEGGSAVVSSEDDSPPAASPPGIAGQPELPPGNPPLGFDGYCVVSMQDEGKWVHGDVRYGVIHRGRTYLFVSEQYKQKFYKEPDKYAPILAGNDPVLMVETGNQVPGSRKLGAYFIDRDDAGRPVFRCLCLFASEESLTRFETKSEVYMDRLRQARVPGTAPK
jgi:protein disulfide-isomerase